MWSKLHSGVKGSICFAVAVILFIVAVVVAGVPILQALGVLIVITVGITVGVLLLFGALYISELFN